MSMTETGYHPRAEMSPLTKIDGVCLLTRKPVDVIMAMADGGDLMEGRYQWVWNVASNPAGDIRDLRFWVGEVLARQRQRELSLDEVISFILPPQRREFPTGEVCQLLQVRRPTLMELRGELQGELRTGSSFYPRAGLVTFLRNRWLGNHRKAS
jgi:hypothetical protein